jgi:hypothetical protein
MNTKTCKGCNHTLPEWRFHCHPNTRDRRHTYCKDCQRVRNQQNYRENQERRKQLSARWAREHPERQAAYARKKNYGLSDKQFAAMFNRQHGACAVCGGEFDTSRRPHVDHDHETGAVRGLLCPGCNTKVAAFESPLRPQIEEYLDSSCSSRMAAGGPERRNVWPAKADW